MPIIKKSNEKLIDYCGCYTVEKKFSNRADWLLGCRSWHKMGSFHCWWSYWKKSQAWTFVVSSSWWTILLISQQIFTRGTNTNQLKSFALYVHWKDEASNATDYSEAASFFSLRRSLVFYSKALQFFLGEALHHNLLQIAWLSFCLKRSNIDKVKWIKKPTS